MTPQTLRKASWHIVLKTSVSIMSCARIRQGCKGVPKEIQGLKMHQGCTGCPKTETPQTRYTPRVHRGVQGVKMHAPDIHRDAPRVRKGGTQSMPQTCTGMPLGCTAAQKGWTRAKDACPRRARQGRFVSNRNSEIESKSHRIALLRNLQYRIESDRNHRPHRNDSNRDQIGIL